MDKGRHQPSRKQDRKHEEKTPQLWKGLQEYSGAPSFKDALHSEFPSDGDFSEQDSSQVSRRSFMGLMASSMALAGITGCKTIRRPEEKILPYNQKPELVVPGRPLFFATAMALGQEVTGLLVESHEGRPTKIEGNTLHPASLGATRPYHQAEILNLYNPERSQRPRRSGRSRVKWESFWNEVGPVIKDHQTNGGKGLSFLSGYITSPSLGAVKRHVLKKFPGAQWHIYEPVNHDNSNAGLRAATGLDVEAHYDFSAAQTILSIDCDFLGSELNSLVWARQYSDYRKPESKRLNRLYMAESDFSMTGARADHRLRLKPGDLEILLWLVAHRIFNQLKVPASGAQHAELTAIFKSASLFPVETEVRLWVNEVCNELTANAGRCLVCVGKYQPPVVHAIAHVINMALGNVGRTVNYKVSATRSLNGTGSTGMPSLQALTRNMEAGQVSTLVILGGDPVYSAPADVDFEQALHKVKTVIHLDTEINDTALASTWHLPRTHFLEEWSDHIAFDGTVSIAQPLIAPLYQSLSLSEFLAVFSGFPDIQSHAIVKEYWAEASGTVDFEIKWQQWLHDGVMKGTRSADIAAPVNYKEIAEVCRKWLKSHREKNNDGIEVIFREDHSLYDGRYANNAWLQELPNPMTRLTWDNAAVMSVATAKKYGFFDDFFLKDGSGIPLGKPDMPVAEIICQNHSLEIPVFILPGMSDNTVLLNLGYGRKNAGKAGSGAGSNVNKIRPSNTSWSDSSASLKNLHKKKKLACVQEHWSMEGRDLAKVRDIHAHPHHGAHGAYPSLWQEHEYKQWQQWGMAIDLDKCTGCGACTLACQAENNIPVVGKDQVILNREMHWIRVDRYFYGNNLNNPGVIHQPISCHHCEMAPCETVCPVAATVHSTDGLNDMVYNRCVGTRYCANNCPYKVRRFNFFNLTKNYTETEKMAQNPDVTVRFRGVMEKCSYCIQRINSSRIASKNKNVEQVPDGLIIPACAQVCPTQAIVFGDINDKSSRVAKLKKQERNYDLLAELNIRPRTSFLARYTNKNDKMAPPAGHSSEPSGHPSGHGSEQGSEHGES